METGAGVTGSGGSTSAVAGIDVSIIIVSFNTREVLRECLQSVALESVNLRTEVLLVDNNSSDGSAEMVEQEFGHVTLIRSETNLGFGAANNVALARARGRYFVLLNSDAFFAPGALGRAIEHMEETPRCGVGGARLVGRDGVLQPSARMFHSLAKDLLVLDGIVRIDFQSRESLVLSIEPGRIRTRRRLWTGCREPSPLFALKRLRKWASLIRDSFSTTRKWIFVSG